MSRALPEKQKRGANVAVEAREAFARWVNEAPEGRHFAQVLVKPDGDGYELRHADDVGQEGLEVYRDPREAREVSKRTEEGEYRPLKTSPNLRRGWVLQLADEGELIVALNHLYPAAVVHWFLDREGRLEITNYRENAARQSGIYKRVQRLSDAGVQDAAKACCEDAVCLKRTLWDVDEDNPLAMERGAGEIPCPEPCSIFVSFARQVRLFEREKKRDLDAIGLSPTEKKDLSSLVESAALGEVEFAREAEFGEPLNERRLRYRGITLPSKLDPDTPDTDVPGTP
ncbi:MAG: DR2241 family protein [Rubrobacteraceae bacterium]